MATVFVVAMSVGVWGPQQSRLVNWIEENSQPGDKMAYMDDVWVGTLYPAEFCSYDEIFCRTGHASIAVNFAKEQGYDLVLISDDLLDGVDTESTDYRWIDIDQFETFS